jgi:uncharacterized protein
VIVDFRVCPPFRSFAQTMVYDPQGSEGLQIGQGPFRSRDERSLPAFFEEMDAAGIDHAVATGRFAPRPRHTIDNDDVVALVREYPDRFSGFGAVDGRDPGAVAEVHRLADAGLKGFTFSNGWNGLSDDDPILDPVYRACAERGLIVAVTNSFFIGDLEFCHPIHLQRMALRHPDLTIVAAHGNYPWVMQLVGVAMQCTNVYLMPDLYINRPSPGRDDYVRAINYYLRHRSLHGSSFPVRSLGDSLDSAQALGIDDEVRGMYFGGTAARLLGLPERSTA